MPPTSKRFRDEKKAIVGWLKWWWRTDRDARERYRTQEQLAKALGITKGRVTQLFQDFNVGGDVLLAIWRLTKLPLEVMAEKPAPTVPVEPSPGSPAAPERAGEADHGPAQGPVHRRRRSR